ncbi:MAG TPA: DUF938 domain-containing protein [Prochlorococcus sp.]
MNESVDIYQDRLHFSATERNRDAIASVLIKTLPTDGRVLEIASGSGEHAVAFQKLFPKLIWHCSDIEPKHLRSINAWIHFEQLEQVMPAPITLDVRNRPWQLPDVLIDHLCGVICINMIHITPWNCCESLIQEASQIVGESAPLILYGPYKRNGLHTSESNAKFDESLRKQDPSWGVRELEDVEQLGLSAGLSLNNIIEMPANNLSLIFRANQS